MRSSSLFVLALVACGIPPAVTSPTGGGAGGGAGGGVGGGVGGGSSMPAADLPCDVAALVSSKCDSCHSNPPQNSAPFPLLSRADFAADSPTFPGTSVAQRSLTRLQSTTAPMPPPYSAQPSAAEVSTFSAWVMAGLPAGNCATTAPPDAGEVMLTCASGSHWTMGDQGSSVMNPGLACRACHLMQDPVRAYAFMGTVFPGLHEENLCFAQGLPIDTMVEILDSTGTVQMTLRPNAAGNFYNLSRTPPFTLPYRARVTAGGKSGEMMTLQADGDCNGCHTERGANGAPGRIVVP
jgi:hypothetical protein